MIRPRRQAPKEPGARERRSAMTTTKTPLSAIISVSDLAWEERQPGVRMKSLWAYEDVKIKGR